MRKMAFTLAETLIVLTSLGVIAAVTIPGIIHNIQDRQAITRVKLAYSIIQKALDIATVEMGPIETWDWPGSSQNLNSIQIGSYFARKMKPYINYTRYGDGGSTGCFNYGWINKTTHSDKVVWPTKSFPKGLNGELAGVGNGLDPQAASCFVLKNGIRISFDGEGNYPNGWYNTGTIITAMVDINGPKKPNRDGYDIFYFDIHRTKGLQLRRIANNKNTSAACYKDSTANESGQNCSTWVLKHNNMDYKYRDVTNEW